MTKEGSSARSAAAPKSNSSGPLSTRQLQRRVSGLGDQRIYGTYELSLSRDDKTSSGFEACQIATGWECAADFARLFVYSAASARANNSLADSPARSSAHP